MKETLSEDEVRRRVASHPHWYHRIALAPGIVTPGINDSDAVLSLLQIPADLTGKRVLDIGTRDGFFAFECERRGAEVVAVDYYPAALTGFEIASTIFESKVTYVQENVFKLTADRFGAFDVVLMLGLLYHLRDPLGALDVVHPLCRDLFILETHVLDGHFVSPDGSVVDLESIDSRLAQTPIMQFCPGTSLNDDPTNYWAPNANCVHAMMREAGLAPFASVRHGNRIIVHGRAMSDDNLLYQRNIARGDAFPLA